MSDTAAPAAASTPVEAAVDAEVGEVVLAAFRLEAALQGSAARWVRRFDTSLGWAADGARSVAGWVSVRVAVSKRRAGGVVRRAKDLAGMAVVGEAFAGGRIGPEQVRMLGEVRELVPGTFAEQEAYLVANVETLTTDGTAVFLQAWLLEALPDGGDDRALKDNVKTHLKFSATTGGTQVSGWLDPETAAAIVGAADAEIDAMHRAGLLDGDTRKRSQLLAEALRTICGRQGQTGDQHGQPRPLALVLVDAHTAAGRPAGAGDPAGRPTEGSAGGAGGPGPANDAADGPAPAPGHGAGSGGTDHDAAEAHDADSTDSTEDVDTVEDMEGDTVEDMDLAPAAGDDAACAPGSGPVTEVDGTAGRHVPTPDPGPDGGQDHTGRVSELIGHGPVAGSTARRLLCDADISLITVTDRGRTVLDVGFTHRLATAAQRRALIVRSGGTCECPGCDAPYTWCQAHHLEPFDPVNRTGPTNLDNLAWLCHKHHHLVHDGGFQLIRGPTGQLELYRRDGTRVHVTLHGRV